VNKIRTARISNAILVSCAATAGRALVAGF
jgi:hypothetical protein